MKNYFIVPLPIIFLKMFGCECFPLFLNSKNHKLQPKSKTYVFIGYAQNYKGYHCFDPSTNKVFTSHHVLFHDHKFSYRALVGPASPVPHTSPMVLSYDWHLTNVASETSSVSVSRSLLDLTRTRSFAASLHTAQPSPRPMLRPAPLPRLPRPLSSQRLMGWQGLFRLLPSTLSRQ